jgi:hypothetical protein
MFYYQKHFTFWGSTPKSDLDIKMREPVDFRYGSLSCGHGLSLLGVTGR